MHRIFAPRSTPPAIVTKLNQAINEVLAQPDVRERVISASAEIAPMSVGQVGDFVRSEIRKNTDLLIRRLLLKDPLRRLRRRRSFSNELIYWLSVAGHPQAFQAPSDIFVNAATMSPFCSVHSSGVRAPQS